MIRLANGWYGTLAKNSPYAIVDSLDGRLGPFTLTTNTPSVRLKRILDTQDWLEFILLLRYFASLGFFVNLS